MHIRSLLLGCAAAVALSSAAFAGGGCQEADKAAYNGYAGDNSRNSTTNGSLSTLGNATYYEVVAFDGKQYLDKKATWEASHEAGHFVPVWQDPIAGSC